MTDSHGNVVQLTDENGKVIKTYEYDSFGNEVKPDSKDDNPFRYCGEYYDKETGEIYLRARYYQPAVGRLLTRDTYTGEEDDSMSLHLYAYCENDGVNMVDPSGHWGKEKMSLNRMLEIIKYPYGFAHQNITHSAFSKLKNKIKYQKNLKYLIEGSVLPDYYDSKSAYKFKYYKKKWKGKILKYEITDKNKMHGKTKSSLDTLKSEVKEKVINLQKNEKQKYLLIGSVLHSIQDYYAHSYALDLSKYKKHADRYAYMVNDKYGTKKEKKIYNSYHSDWAAFDGIEGVNSVTHRQYKDNPYASFDKKTGKWEICSSREKNKRYMKAINKSKKYLEKVLK